MSRDTTLHRQLEGIHPDVSTYQHNIPFILAIFNLYNLHNRYDDHLGDKEEDGDEDMGSRKVTSKCILLQNFILLPFLYFSFVRVIKFITNRKYAYFCIYYVRL